MKDSKEFALELYDALSRRRRLKGEKISHDELYEYWLQINDDSFDSRLQIFFDMYVSFLEKRKLYLMIKVMRLLLVIMLFLLIIIILKAHNNHFTINDPSRSVFLIMIMVICMCAGIIVPDDAYVLIILNSFSYYRTFDFN